MNTTQGEFARKKIARFVQRFDESYRWLAYYAALPLILTPELLNYLRNHFLHGQVPWVAEADLLLSELCRPVGYEQYALEPDVRAYLIGEMHEVLGEDRMQEVSRLLIRYVHQLQRLKHPVNPYELQAERWSAMAFIADRRGEVVREIAESFRDQLVGDVPNTTGEKTWINEAEFARLVRITQELAPQMEEYPELLNYAQKVSRLLADPARLAAMREQRVVETLPTTQVGGIDLPALDRSVKATLEVTEQNDEVQIEGKGVEVEAQTKKIFISYANEDRPWVRILAEALEACGWEVWWDRRIPRSKPFDEVIAEQLEAAKCVIVVWSRHSVRSDWVRDEVHEARRRKILIPVVIDDVTPPFGYRRIQAANLGDWKPSEPFPMFNKLVADIALILGQPPVDKTGSKAQAQQAATAASEAEAVLTSSKARPELPPIQDIHGWPAERVKALQAQTVHALGMPVTFRDGLKDGGEGPEMAVIPAGRFLMGSPEDEPERYSNERQHAATIERPFAIGRYAVTFEEYDRFAKATGREKANDQGRGRGRRPVINVSWHDAVAYAEWLSKQTGQKYRLPTEAEWEYAARAGTTTPCHFGTTISTDQANYDGNYTYVSGPKEIDRSQTVEVGQFPANAWGLHQVHGNVWEWTCSEYDEGYSGAELRCLGKNHVNDGASLVIRGGSWDIRPRWVRAALRSGFAPSVRTSYVGFRLARTLTL